MPEVFTEASQITPQWLAELLRVQGILACGEVLAVEAVTNAALLASVGQLSIPILQRPAPRHPGGCF